MNDIKRTSFVPAAVLLLASACTKSPPQPDLPTNDGGGPPSATAAPASATASATTSATAAESGSCAAILSQFAAVRARGTTACKKDADCKCFNGLDAAVPCGGVIDAKTAVELGALQKDFHTKSCRLSHQCAAQLCNPGCDEGRCVMAKKR